MWLYHLAIRVYGLLLRLAAGLGHRQAKAWVSGRQAWPAKYQKQLEQLPAGRQRIWIHCASLGEFEQGRPIIEAIKKRYPDSLVLLSFFSPSGYTIRYNYEQADWVGYMPLDTAKNARQFLSVLQPDLAIFVKYEFWLNHLAALRQKGVPTILVSALFRPDQAFFRWYAGPFKAALQGIEAIFVQNQASLELLDTHGYPQGCLAGDTRVDRVISGASAPKAFPLLHSLFENSPVLVAGSSWPPDEAILLPFLQHHLPDDWKVILAPHQVDTAHIEALEDALPLSYIKLSEVRHDMAADTRILLVDTIGQLAQLYQFGTIAYIGGGFGAGIHNTLEPMAFGLPVIFGPKYQKFTEAVALVAQSGAFPVHDQKDLEQVFAQLNTATAFSQAREAVAAYLQANRGATDRIIAYLEQQRYLK